MLKQDLTLQIMNQNAIPFKGNCQKEKNEKVIRLMKDERGRKIKTKFVGLRANTYSYLIDGGSEDKKKQEAKKSV